jgi:alpha-beta hydrolase superfamily lysophospholipase
VLLHGGAETGVDPVTRWAGPPLRMIPFGWAIRRRDRRVAVARVRFRHRGWNGAAEHPLADVADVLRRIADRRPGLPVVLVGHSMGGRAALRSAGADAVVGVVALAPWVPAADPTGQLAGRAVVIVHGTDDRRTAPAASAAFAERIADVAGSVRYVPLPGSDHAMLRDWSRWHRVTAEAVITILDPILDTTRAT